MLYEGCLKKIVPNYSPFSVTNFAENWHNHLRNPNKYLNKVVFENIKYFVYDGI